MSEREENISQQVKQEQVEIKEEGNPSIRKSSSMSDSGSVSYQSDSYSDASQGVETPASDDNKKDGRVKYKYCCKVCKHTDSSKKACVCVVPLDQRRTAIGDQGCQTCGCSGCSKEDFISRGEDPVYKPGQKHHHKVKKQKDLAEFEARNGCCRKCMKAFSKSNKSCLCQVPEEVRNTKLPCSGCKICGCFGCNPEDKKDPKNRKRKTPVNIAAVRKDKSRSRQKKKKSSHHRSRSSSSSESRQYIDAKTMNFYNIEKSVIGTMIAKEYRIDMTLLGFGVPQRMHSYIIGRPK